VLSWSLPFLAEKVSSMLFTIVKKCSNIDDDDTDVNITEIMNEEINKTKVPQEQDKIKKRMLIKGKI
jgi:hypothetical protein